MLEAQDAEPQQLDSCDYQGGRVPWVHALQKIVKLYMNLRVSGCLLVGQYRSWPAVLLYGLWEASICIGAPKLATIHFMWWNLVAGTVCLH